MPLKGNGQLLVKVINKRYANFANTGDFLTLDGYTIEPLLRESIARALVEPITPSDHWLLAKPSVQVSAESPWDAAHRAARANKYAHYIEPDIIHEKQRVPSMLAENMPAEGLNKDWPPYASNEDGVDPGWHLQNNFTGFRRVRNEATGKGVRIAHLDTGYTPDHISRPRNLKPELGYDYWDDKLSTVDPGTQTLFGIGFNPGHGTATLALLAGSQVTLIFGQQKFTGDIGGAPDADVIPVRISPSVIHLYTSAMAKGLYHALSPNGDPANKCDVVSISHGGLPSESWADAVNTLYEAGVVIAAASGDSYYLMGASIATHYTVYPSAFNRVVTVVGATYEKKPYKTDKNFVMQGCWGPTSVMEKAVAGYTPNIAWMKRDRTPDGFDMNGAGTSASTPQVAAACALWLQCYGAQLPTDWLRVEACRAALFASVDTTKDRDTLGWGTLNVPKMLDQALAGKIVAAARAGKLLQSAKDSVSFPFWRLLFGAGPPDSAEEKMYETEVAQLAHQSANAELREAVMKAPDALPKSDSSQHKEHLRSMLLNENISAALKQRLTRS